MLAGLCTWIARGPFTHCIRLSVGISEVATENLKQVKRKEQTLAKGTLGDHIYIYIHMCYVSNSHEGPGEIVYISWTARLVEPNHERTVNSHQQLHLKVSTITLAQNLDPNWRPGHSRPINQTCLYLNIMPSPWINIINKSVEIYWAIHPTSIKNPSINPSIQQSFHQKNHQTIHQKIQQ